MGQMQGKPSGPVCSTCQTPFSDSDKFCTGCGAINPIFRQAYGIGLPPSPGRRPANLQRAETLRRSPSNQRRCPNCNTQCESDQGFCGLCGQGLPENKRAESGGGLRRGNSYRGSQADPADFHPMGDEALVTPRGRPTKKMEALSNAIYDMLIADVPSLTKLVDITRLKFLERHLGRQAQHTLSELSPHIVLQLFNVLGFEHELVRLPPPASDRETPCLTKPGFLKYLTHGVLYDPNEAVRELTQLLSTVRLPRPPAWLGPTWRVHASMVLGAPHPDALALQDRVAEQLAHSGVTPVDYADDRAARRNDRPGHSRKRSSPAASAYSLPASYPPYAPYAQYPPYGYAWPPYPTSPYGPPSPYLYPGGSPYGPYTPPLYQPPSPYLRPHRQRRSSERDRPIFMDTGDLR